MQNKILIAMKCGGFCLGVLERIQPAFFNASIITGSELLEEAADGLRHSCVPVFSSSLNSPPGG